MIELTSAVKYYHFNTELMIVSYKQIDYLTLNNFTFSSASAFVVRKINQAYLKSQENSFAFTTDFTIAYQQNQIKLKIEPKSLLNLQKKLNPSKIKKIIGHFKANFEISFTFTKLTNLNHMSYHIMTTIKLMINLPINYQKYYWNTNSTFKLVKTDFTRLQIIQFSN